jgi:hypothetical protein
MFMSITDQTGYNVRAVPSDACMMHIYITQSLIPMTPVVTGKKYYFLLYVITDTSTTDIISSITSCFQHGTV